MPLTPSTRLAGYDVLSLIGAGGMGEVYHARDTKLGRDVALKVFPAMFAQDTDRMARFQREAHVLALLNHPNITGIYDVEEQALVMEFVEGPALSEKIAAARIPTGEAVSIAVQIADALEYAHAKGIVHRDLKPANIKVTPDGRVKCWTSGWRKHWSPVARTTIPQHLPR